MYVGEDRGVKPEEGFAGDGYGGLKGGASSLQLAEAVNSLSWRNFLGFSMVLGPILQSISFLLILWVKCLLSDRV
ncbi:uncharacterized protein LOC130140591 isoform X2 [Syzygium oleosum]|uniref:uncharacterized protein LOC130140591 isoform X2 n=1 Tax=Syzygium oleosum TaxID=219896 RepID=UPI0024B950A5|nr:uncharacterized protein LOC130140591 isoform X2 [Syzygium oleosum]